MDPDVPEDQITLATPDIEKDVKKLISYAIGCMMGRYSLDEPGLIYAHSGNIGFDPTKYGTFPVDDDGILPITDMEWFPDDGTIRFIDFIKTAWPTDTLEENLKFIAESLTGKQITDSREAIRKYLSSNFFKDHLQTYKNRPIYWLFSSGKQKAFECLIYLNRYNEATLSRLRSNYVIPLQGKLNGRIALMERDLNEGSQKQSTKIRKEIETLRKKQIELASFDDRLRHYADMRISLDLDDGVKVNYGKFGDLLVETSKVTGVK
jgi:type II restriction/modification system DNA methylase subunit YeeA